MRNPAAGASLMEIILILTVLAVMATMFVPLASGLVDVQRANGEADELKAIYTAIVGDRSLNTYGYLGDVGDYPSSLLDLVQKPASNPIGWNGPYITNVRIENGILYDQFGGPIEYFHASLPTPPAVGTDQFALISRGPDRSSSYSGNNNPNQSTNFNGTLPSDSSYGSSVTNISNVDNIVYPAFMDNSNLVNYQSLGTLNISINNYDESPAVTASVQAPVQNFVPGCPGLYDILIASLTHPASTSSPSYEAWATYAPGGASFDLLQGNYLVTVRISGAFYPIWQEQISIEPGKAVTKYLALPGVDSSESAGTIPPPLLTVPLTVFNNYSSISLQPMMYGSNMGGTINANMNAVVNNASYPKPCARIQMKDATTGTHPIVDSFIMPAVAYTRRETNSATTYNLTVTNTSVRMLAIYDDGILVGTVGMRGNKRVKTFKIRAGHIVTLEDNGGNPVGSSITMSGNQTYP